MALSPLLSAAMLVGLVFQPPTSAPQPPAVEFEEINGRTDPDRIPLEVAWENLFTVIVVTLEDAEQFEEERIRALAVHNLHIDVNQMRRLVVIAARTRADLVILRSPLAREHQGEPLDWSQAQRQQRLRDIRDAALNGRNAVRKQLSPKAVAAIEMYIREQVVPGTTILQRKGQQDGVPDGICQELEIAYSGLLRPGGGMTRRARHRCVPFDVSRLAATA